METKNIINILIVSIVIVLIMIGFKTVERINADYMQQRGDDLYKGGDDNQELPQEKPEGLEVGGGEAAGGRGSGTGGTAETSNRTDLPSDLYTRPCSFYFSEYDVCAGVCPAGTCQRVEKSCYCV